jgi:hypothetical protein
LGNALVLHLPQLPSVPNLVRLLHHWKSCPEEKKTTSNHNAQQSTVSKDQGNSSYSGISCCLFDLKPIYRLLIPFISPWQACTKSPLHVLAPLDHQVVHFTVFTGMTSTYLLLDKISEKQMIPHFYSWQKLNCHIDFLKTWLAIDILWQHRKRNFMFSMNIRVGQNCIRLAEVWPWPPLSSSFTEAVTTITVQELSDITSTESQRTKCHH